MDQAIGTANIDESAELPQTRDPSVSDLTFFQLVDHFAYRRGLSGLDGSPVLLYQNVEQWQLGAQTPAEAK